MRGVTVNAGVAGIMMCVLRSLLHAPFLCAQM